MTHVEDITIIKGTECVKRSQISRLREGSYRMTNWKPTFGHGKCYHHECNCHPIVKLTPYGDSQGVREMIVRDMPELLEEYGKGEKMFFLGKASGKRSKRIHKFFAENIVS